MNLTDEMVVFEHRHTIELDDRNCLSLVINKFIKKSISTLRS